MKKVIILIFGMLLLSMSQAFPVEFSYETKHENGSHYLEITQAKKIILTYVSDHNPNDLEEVIFFALKGKDYALTRWNKGAHSQWARIFLLDGKTNAPVWEYACTWPYEYVITSDHVLIKFAEGMPDRLDKLPDMTQKVFHP